jgi:hypothetical protein
MDKEQLIFGKITPPSFISENPSGLITLFNNLLRLLIVGGGIYALLNFIIAGYSFMSANNDPKKIDLAWAKIWQSMVGLLIIAISFALAALLGQILFHSPTAILNPKIYGPGGTQGQ